MNIPAVPPAVCDSSTERRPLRRRTGADSGKATGRAWSAAGVLATVALLASPTAHAATVLTIEPLNLGQGPIIDTELEGALCAAPNTCQPVNYPAALSALSIPTGAAALNSLIGTTTKPVVVFGYSEGAQVAGMWMAQYGKSPDAPAAQDVSFVLIGNPNRAYGGASNALAQVLNIATPTDTKYQVTDVAREYDFWADLPTGQLNPIALLNAVAGSLFIHTDYTKVDLTDPNNVTWKKGNITYVLVPTTTLPLFLPLKWVGFGSLADSLSAKYRPIVDSAYNRPVPLPAPNTTTAAAPHPGAPEVTAASTAVTMPQPGPVSAPKSAATNSHTSRGSGANATVSPGGTAPSPTASLRIKAQSAGSPSGNDSAPRAASKAHRDNASAP